MSNWNLEESTNEAIKTFTSYKYVDSTSRLFREAAGGGYINQFQTFLIGIDRYKKNYLPSTNEHHGLTFITRPRLNLSTASIRQNRIMAPLDTMNPKSLGFMIRCLLDTKFCNDHIDISLGSPFINTLNPFNVPLINGLVGITGWPDFSVETYTTDGGFHSEDQTFVIGSDRLSKTYDLSLTFKDIQVSPIASMFQYWLEYMACVTKGSMLAYIDDIEAQRLNYTVSIYKFNLDPTRKYITRYSKATGCFPKSLPIGSMFNENEEDLYVGSAGKFSVPFVANDIKYNDYGILMDFNRLVKRYCPEIDAYGNYTANSINNFYGIPYVESDKNGILLSFKGPVEDDIENDSKEVSV